MTEERITSRSLRGSTEITLLAPVKKGFVSFADPMTYAKRLQTLLDVLFKLRKASAEGGVGDAGALEKLHSIHFIHFTVFEKENLLLLVVDFDRPWEPYIRLIVDEAGPILDVIFSHCEGYENHTSQHGYEKFAEWVRDNQRPCGFFYSAYPGLTVDDIQYLKNVGRLVERMEVGPHEAVRKQDLSRASLSARVDPNIVGQARGLAERYVELLRAAAALYRIRSYFPETDGRNVHDDRVLYDRACQVILPGSLPPGLPRPKVPESAKREYPGFEAWFEWLWDRPAQNEVPVVASPLDVQGGVLEPHRDSGEPMTHGCLILIELKNQADAADFLQYMLQRLSHRGGGEARYNVALTRAGLEKILGDETVQDKFPREFIEGMEDRAGLLGDVGTNHPRMWKRPRRNAGERPNGQEVPLNTVDAVVLIEKRICRGKPGDHVWSDDHPLEPEVRALDEHCRKPGVKQGDKHCGVLHVQALRRYENRIEGGFVREHFGFLDGFSQPTIRTQYREPVGVNEIALGETLLGEPNDRGETDKAAKEDPVRNHGTFMVVRKLAQDVGAFRAFVNDGGPKEPRDEKLEVLEAKMMGRYPDGTPTTPNASRTNNEFDYDGDLGGGCPLQAHVRLSNPRTPAQVSVHGKLRRVPRIMRRGMSYGRPYDGAETEERGLLFMAMNASLAEQYEVIQRWLNGANATGLSSSQKDPITGPSEGQRGVFRYNDENGELRAVELPAVPFVRLEWGMYLFVPSLAGLDELKKKAAAAPKPKVPGP